jgi:hypothetical protein
MNACAQSLFVIAVSRAGRGKVLVDIESHVDEFVALPETDLNTDATGRL